MYSLKPPRLADSKMPATPCTTGPSNVRVSCRSTRMLSSAAKASKLGWMLLFASRRVLSNARDRVASFMISSDKPCASFSWASAAFSSAIRCDASGIASFPPASLILSGSVNRLSCPLYSFMKSDTLAFTSMTFDSTSRGNSSTVWLRCAALSSSDCWRSRQV